MENKDYQTYDSMIETAVKWLLWCHRENQSDLGFSNFQSLSERNLWLMNIGNIYSTVSGGRPIYIDFSLKYLYLRYIKKLKYYRPIKKNQRIFWIDIDAFLEDVRQSYDQKDNIFAEIYKEYYK